MPLYEYLCKKCGHRFEEIKKFSDKQPKKCPECGGVIEQVISAPSVQFKGSGWYVTDYAKKSSSATGTSSSSNSPDSETGGSESKDSNSKESKDSNETKDNKDRKESKDSKKEDKPKSESSSKKQKKD